MTRISAVGTANFDNRSFRLNFEIMAVVYDPDFAKEIEEMLLADMEDSVEMQPGDLDKKSYLVQARHPSRAVDCADSITGMSHRRTSRI